MAAAFILLTVYLIPVCILVSWKSIRYGVKFFILLLFFIELFMIVAFSSASIFVFFVSFEALLIPLFFMIGFFGTRQRRVKASFYLVFYTLVGSIPLLLGIFYIWTLTGSFDYLYIREVSSLFLQSDKFILWLLFFPAFAFKIPLYPFHLWLGEAHVEAPTAGSVILAGLLLKLGGFGFIRFLVSLFSSAGLYFTNFIFLLSIISMIFASFAALIQTDMKRIIAYSSITHMAMAVMGIFSNNVIGLQGSIFLMLGHGIVSSALFILIGILYERYGTRYIRYYGGLTTTMPWFSRYFFFFILSNIGFPGTPGFAAELLLFISIFNRSAGFLFFIFLALTVSVNVMLLLYNKICNGTAHINSVPYFVDLDMREHIILFSLFFISLFMGLCPQLFLDFVSTTFYYYF
jgi:NADH-quinone oxidoreductase subunit M